MSSSQQQPEGHPWQPVRKLHTPAPPTRIHHPQQDKQLARFIATSVHRYRVRPYFSVYIIRIPVVFLLFLKQSGPNFFFITVSSFHIKQSTVSAPQKFSTWHLRSPHRTPSAAQAPGHGSATAPPGQGSRARSALARSTRRSFSRQAVPWKTTETKSQEVVS